MQKYHHIKIQQKILKKSTSFRRLINIKSVNGTQVIRPSDRHYEVLRKTNYKQATYFIFKVQIRIKRNIISNNGNNSNIAKVDDLNLYERIDR